MCSRSPYDWPASNSGTAGIRTVRNSGEENVAVAISSSWAKREFVVSLAGSDYFEVVLTKLKLHPLTYRLLV